MILSTALKRFVLFSFLLAAIFLSPSSAHAQLPPDIVGYWSFNYGNGNDDTGTYHAVVPPVSDTPIVQTKLDCAVGRCFRFNSTDGNEDAFQTTALIPSYPDVTISAWFKTSFAGGNQLIVLFGEAIWASANLDWALRIQNTGRVEIAGWRYFGGGGMSVFTPLAISYIDNKWHHVLATIDASTNIAYIYMDGEFSAQGGVRPFTANKSGYITIGSRSTLDNEHFNGSIDEVRFYNTYFTAAEAKNDYLRNAGGAFCNTDVNNCSEGTSCEKGTCVPTLENRTVGTYCKLVEHCDINTEHFELTCDKDNNICVGSMQGIDCSDTTVNTNELFGSTDVSRENRCDDSLVCVLEDGVGECKQDMGTSFAESFGLGGSTRDIRDQIRSIINMALGFLGVVGVILVIYAGGTWLTAAGDDDKVSKAKKTLVAAIIGIVIISIAWTITSFALRTATDLAG